MSKPGFPTDSWSGYSYHGEFQTTSGAIFNSTNSGSVETFYRDKTGSNTPGWPHFKQDNYYMTVSSSLRPSSMSYHFDAPGIGTARGEDSAVVKAVGSDGAGQVLAASWPIIADLYSAAQAKLYNKLIDQVRNQKVNYAQVFAERRQTYDLVLSTAKKLAESFTALRRGNIAHAITALTGSSRHRRGIGSLAGGVPEQWLALQYGWKPLLSDIYGSAEELARYHNDTPGPVYAEARASGRATQNGVVERFGLPGTGNPDWDLQYKGNAKGNSLIVFRINNSVSSAASRTGLTNPLSLAWELLPYSFVVDWFYPVGNYLANLDYSIGLGFERGWENMKVELDWTAKPKNTNRWPNGFSSGGWAGGSWDARVNYFQRLPVGTFPLPPVPRLKDPFSSTHVANALALMATAFRGTSRLR